MSKRLILFFGCLDRSGHYWRTMPVFRCDRCRHEESEHRDMGDMECEHCDCLNFIRPLQWASYYMPTALEPPESAAPKLFQYIDGDREHRFRPSDEKQGAAKLTVEDGWTLLSWHDYLVDKRPGSNSAVLVNQVRTFQDMRTLAESIFGKERAELVEIP
jgi:hypothetical protein